MKSYKKFIFAGIFFLGYVAFTSSISVSSKATDSEVKQIASKQHTGVIKALKKSK